MKDVEGKFWIKILTYYLRVDKIHWMRIRNVNDHIIINMDYADTDFEFTYKPNEAEKVSVILESIFEIKRSDPCEPKKSD